MSRNSASSVDEFDHVVICGAGDLCSLASACEDVSGVESVGVFTDQMRLLVRHGRGILCRLVELAELAEVDITLVVVLPQDS